MRTSLYLSLMQYSRRFIPCLPFFGTYLRLDLLLESATGCPGRTCINLCGWKGAILSLFLVRLALLIVEGSPAVRASLAGRHSWPLKRGGLSTLRWPLFKGNYVKLRLYPYLPRFPLSP